MGFEDMIIDIILVDIVLVLVDFHFVTDQGNEIWYKTSTPKKGGFQGWDVVGFHQLKKYIVRVDIVPVIGLGVISLNFKLDT